MAREKITVELSREDRALLKSIRDELRAAGITNRQQVQLGEETVRRLIEDMPESVARAANRGNRALHSENGSSNPNETYPDDPTGAIEEHYQWNGSGWVPRPPDEVDRQVNALVYDGVHVPRSDVN